MRMISRKKISRSIWTKMPPSWSLCSTLRLGTRVGCWGLDGKLKVIREFLNLISKDSAIKPIKEGFFREIGVSYFGTLVYRNDLMWARQVGESW